MSVTGISYNKNRECFVLDCSDENIFHSQTSIKDFYNDGKIKEKFITSRMHSKTGIFVILIFTLGISCAVAFLSYAYFSRLWSKHYCLSPLCKRSAQNLIAAMNISIDPCEDFYQFACGRFPEYKPTPKYNLRSDWFDIGSDLLLKNVSNYLEKNSSTSDPNPVQQARYLYRQCKDIAGRQDENFDPISRVLNRVGLPSLPPLQKMSSNFSLLDSLVRSKLIYDKDFFISFSITMDPKNRTRYRLFLSKPSDAPPLPVHYNHILLYDLKKRLIERVQENDDDVQESQFTDSNESSYEPRSNEETRNKSNSTDEVDEYTATFYQYASSIFEFAYNSSNLAESWLDVPNATIEENILNLMNTDILVDKLVITHFPNDSMTPIPMHMSVKNLQKMTQDLWAKNSSIPIIDWREYFKQMFKDIPEISLDFEDENLDAEIVVKDIFYISMMLSWLSYASPQQLEMYMWWITVTTIAPYTSSKIRGYADDFLHTLKAIDPKPRQFLCADVVNTIFGMATAYSLALDTDKANDIKKVEDMVENIQLTFQESMKNIDWMDQKTKNLTTEKLKNMKTCVGFPPWLKEKDRLEEYYAEYSEINLKKYSFLENILELTRIGSISELKSYREEIDLEQEMWVFDPMDVNAYNWLEGNRITIPVGILQFPFFEQGLEVLNYGSIGSIIGHELTHGFDNTGKEYDATGEANLWWTDETMDEFNKRKQCFIDHYETFPDDSESTEETSSDEEYDIPNLNKGSRTLDENIADNGGLRNALYAYRNYVLENGPEISLPELKEYSSEQLFFLAFANTWCKAFNEDDSYSRSTDEHSPNHVRVWGTLTNSKEFAEAWKCKEGTAMNPSPKKCELW